MEASKTKQIFKRYGLKEMRELVKRKIRSNHQSQVRKVMQSDLLQVLDAGSLDCQICYCPLVEPVTLSCGHSCCLQCLQEGSLKSGRCSFCKQHIAIKEISINKAMQRFVKRSLNLLGPHHRNSYRHQQHKIDARSKVRGVNYSCLSVGDDIDYRDSIRMVWFKGSVMQIQEGNNEKLIYVQFSKKHQDPRGFDIFSSHSKSLAPANFFSNRSTHNRPKPLPPRFRGSFPDRIKLSPNSNHVIPMLTAP